MPEYRLDPFYVAEADSDFERALAVPESLLHIRPASGRAKGKTGFQGMALNRAVVVLSVAAWQGWVERYAELWLVATYHVGDLEGPPRRDDEKYLMLLAANRALHRIADRELRRFSTPATGQVVELMGLLGDEPRARWYFTHAGRRLAPRDVARRLDAWVKVRHAIAHGDMQLPAVEVLARTKGGHGSLTRRRAEQCIKFFRSLVRATGGSA